jgi:hypothetical protein
MARKSGSELVLAAGKRPRLVKARKNSWTKQRRDAFVEALASTCNIAAALRKVRMSRSGLDRLRARDAEFRARMREAVREAYRNLELFTIEKMMSGTVKTVTKADGAVETVHEYPLNLAVQLLRLHRDNAPDTEDAPMGEDREEVTNRLLRKIAAVRKRLDTGAEGAGGAEA